MSRFLFLIFFFNCQKLVLQNNSNKTKTPQRFRRETICQDVFPGHSSRPKKTTQQGYLLYFVWYLTNVLEQVERSTQHGLKTTFPRIMGETAPGTGTGAPMQTQPCWGAGFCSRRLSEIQIFKDLIYLYYSSRQHEQGDRCLQAIKSNMFSY